MKVPGPDDTTPLAWNAIIADTPVFSSDGAEVGGVYEVLGAEDIFHGLVVRAGPAGHHKMIPGARVSSITNRRIDSDLTAEEIRSLPPYNPEESFQLGLVGLFRKHLGWVHEGEHDKHGKD